MYPTEASPSFDNRPVCGAEGNLTISAYVTRVEVKKSQKIISVLLNDGEVRFFDNRPDSQVKAGDTNLGRTRLYIEERRYYGKIHLYIYLNPLQNYTTEPLPINIGNISRDNLCQHIRTTLLPTIN